MSEEFKNVRYSSPAEALHNNEEPLHHFDVFKGDEKIAGAEVNYLSKPIPHYQVSDLYVDPHHQGEGVGSHIMEQVETFLIERKKPGFLVDSIMEDSEASGMYERRGWKAVPDSHGLFVFNWPEATPLDILKGYPSRYTDYLERGSVH